MRKIALTGLNWQDDSNAVALQMTPTCGTDQVVQRPLQFIVAIVSSTEQPNVCSFLYTNCVFDAVFQYCVQSSLGL